MGRELSDATVHYHELQWSWLNEVEFAEKAHVLKILARELGQDTAPAISELCQHGLEAALAAMAVAVGANVSDAYLRHRALWRAAQAV